MKYIVFVLVGIGIWTSYGVSEARSYSNTMPEDAPYDGREYDDSLDEGFFDATGYHPPYDDHYTYPCDPYYVCPGVWNQDLGFDPGYGGDWWRDHPWGNKRWGDRRWDNASWDHNFRWGHGGRWDHNKRWGYGGMNRWRWHNSPVRSGGGGRGGGFHGGPGLHP